MLEREMDGPLDEGLEAALRVDALLRFEPRVASRYERQFGEARVAALRHHMLVGLVFFNIYDLTDVLIMPDSAWLVVVLRSFAITPGTLLLALALGRMSSRWRECAMTLGMLAVLVVGLALFWWTSAPLAGYGLGELPLTLVFANMVLTLRFAHAAAFTACTLTLGAGVVLAKHGFDPDAKAILVIQIVTSCAFSLYANFRIEASRCRGYLDDLRALLKIDRAEAASHRLRDLSMTDALTELPNRRALDAAVRQYAAAGRSCAVLMIDVDCFKLFNDSFGHPTGDDCLRRVAAALRATVPVSGHLLARFGGEEFTLLMEDLDAFSAARQGAEIVRAVERLGIVHPARRDGERVVTVSVGIALTDHAATWDEAFQSADRALYEAKRGGRNRYALAREATAGAAARTTA